MTIRLRRWTMLLVVASLLLGSCSDPATTDADLEAADEDARETEDAQELASVPAPAGLPMDAAGWILFQAVFDGDVVDLGLVRPDGSELQRVPGGPGNRWHPDWSPDGTLIVYDHGLPDGRAEIRTVLSTAATTAWSSAARTPASDRRVRPGHRTGAASPSTATKDPPTGSNTSGATWATTTSTPIRYDASSNGPAAIRTNTPTTVVSPRGSTCVSAPTASGSSSRVRGRGASGPSSPRPSRGRS
jgi:hypothetical protein